MRESLFNGMQLIKLAERLKFELRHSWLSNGRQESVAEHSWRLALMVIVFGPELDQPIHIEKALKMAVIHDLVEAIVGDTPTWDHHINQKNVLVEKLQLEKKAIEEIRSILNGVLGDEIYTLWHEFEAHESYEAKFVCALDKLECQLQHIEADFSTWNEVEKQNNYQWLAKYCDFDSALKTLKEIISAQGVAKIARHTSLLEVD